VSEAAGQVVREAQSVPAVVVAHREVQVRLVAQHQAVQRPAALPREGLVGRAQAGRVEVQAAQEVREVQVDRVAMQLLDTVRISLHLPESTASLQKMGTFANSRGS